MYLWQHSGSNFCGSTLAQMPGGFDIAIEHICIEPFVYLVDYGRLGALSRFAAYTVTHGTAVADLEEKYGRMRYALEMALQHIAGDDPRQVDYGCYLHSVDYGRLVATSRFGPEEIGSQDEESEHAREEIASLSDVLTQIVFNVISDLAINEPKILQDLRDHEHEQYTENVGIETIRAKWASQGNENEWFHLWQRAEEPAVQRLLIIAAKAATDLPPVSSDPASSDPAQPDKSRRL